MCFAVTLISLHSFGSMVHSELDLNTFILYYNALLLNAHILYSVLAFWPSCCMPGGWLTPTLAGSLLQAC